MLVALLLGILVDDSLTGFGVLNRYVLAVAMHPKSHHLRHFVQDNITYRSCEIIAMLKCPCVTSGDALMKFRELAWTVIDNWRGESVAMTIARY